VFSIRHIFHNPSTRLFSLSSNHSHFHHPSPRPTCTSTSTFLQQSPLCQIIMTDKSSSQQTADALFLLDALQHVTSTVVVCQPKITYLPQLALTFSNIRSTPARSQPRKTQKSTQSRNASRPSNSATTSTFKPPPLAAQHQQRRPSPEQRKSPKNRRPRRMLARRQTLPWLLP